MLGHRTLPAGDALSAPSLIWIVSMDSDEEEGDQELASRSVSVSSKGVHHDEEAPTEPRDGLFDDVGSHGDEDD
jgi:hypothetical protein